jgi:murein DD-endopeptidase MepM/ murein hydrolase activator NlpD
VFQDVSTHRVAGLLSLAIVVTFAAVTVAGGAPRASDSVEAAPSAALLEQQRPLRRDMRAFAKRMRRQRERELMRSGVVPIRGPVDYGTGTNGFGAGRGGHVHGGQDMFAPTGTPLVAVRDGIVSETGSDGGRGNYLMIYSRAAKQTYSYFHMVQPASVEQGEKVRAGERVGAVGCSGSCDGAHLHFEVHRGRGARGEGIDPMPLIERWHRLPARA